MLTRDRPTLAPKAIACFMRQTYPNKALLIYDTGEVPLSVELPDVAHARPSEEILQKVRQLPIGALRNNANRLVNADVIVHWDDDDWSHPHRIENQVCQLQNFNAEIVGLRSMLFERRGEAWIYQNARKDYALGTSLCYWRKTWEKRMFHDDLPRAKDHVPYDGRGEDTEFIEGMKVWSDAGVTPKRDVADFAPVMIARIHGGNTSRGYDNLQEGPSWQRAPYWDERVREILA